MSATSDRAIAIVGVGSILPDAPDTHTFWKNLQAGRYSISDVPIERWDPARYYDADPHAPEKTYSRIGGWVRDFAWDPARWKLPVPPKVGDAMDAGQKWAITCTREALLDYGYPDRPLDRARTAVILGNAMAGEKHYQTALRVFFPELAHALASAPSFAALPESVRTAIETESRALLGQALPPITEDTMPGELSNVIAGRVANLFDFHGPNYVVDAACASAVAAFSAAIEGLIEHDYDAVVTGGIDRNMGPSAYVKFCKIGALSATGTRPYADGADGFVMGEGAVVFLLKRLADAERAGDKIYAVVRGIGGSSDGRGKGITAPNPVGQKLAVERAWENAGLSPATASLIEGHGTSTRVGDVVEVEAISDVLRVAGAAPHSIALGSVKSNIGHLKAAAGAAGLLKVALALHHKILVPSLGFARPNPAIDFERSPLVVNTTLRPWAEPACGVRRAGVSAFGFGGTNFHAVLEEYVPGALTGSRSTAPVSEPRSASGAAANAAQSAAPTKAARIAAAASARPPLRGALLLGAESPAALAEQLASVQRAAAGGHAPPFAAPTAEALAAPERLAIDYGDAAELADKAGKALKALRGSEAAAWRMLRQQGVFRGRGARGKLAFLYTGQGSQYVGMLDGLRRVEPVVAHTFAEADEVMQPLLGEPLTHYIFPAVADAEGKARAEQALRQTAITQPAILAADLALTRLLGAFGVRPDVVMGHSLGEYGALVAAGALSFHDALEAVSARGREMTNVAVEDCGKMVAVTAPLDELERVLAATEGYVVIANLNSPKQAVIGGASAAVEAAAKTLAARGFTCTPLPVSHAFHTRIVAPASEPLRRVLERLDVRPPRLPVIANVTGEPYPSHEGARTEVLDLLARQVAAPVQFVKGLERLYADGVRTLIEVGPKRALAGLADDTLGHLPEVLALSTNHPKLADAVAFNQALCGLYAAGFGAAAPVVASTVGTTGAAAVERSGRARVVITGAALGLPGSARVFDEDNVARLLRGESLIDVVPARFRKAMVDKHITRVVKGEDGSGSFQLIDDPDEVIRLAGRSGALELEAEFGVPAERLAALDVVTRLAIGAGLDALRDAGIPLVHHYKTTSKGTRLPERWGLPEALRDDTGVIFASAFPGLDSFADDLTRYHRALARREKLALLDSVLAHLPPGVEPHLRTELGYQRDELVAQMEREPFQFDRRFLFRVLAMGHSQFAELIGARGPNTQLNAACASTTQALSLAEDWIGAGRCRRVIVIAGDDVTSDHLLEWIGAGFLSSGAAATDDVVEKAALPFDRRRHGMLMGMGAAALVVESAECARERGLRPIAELLGSIAANSAFHGTRLDVAHIGKVMESLVRRAEAAGGAPRQAMAAEMVFVSHETYTPARGGSASAEIHALREVFGEAASRIVIANTKGFTGHAMGVGIEDVLAVKALETGIVPPVPNHHEVDPELGVLNLSHGGPYPVRYALRLGAGFGSQIAMALLRWVASPDGSRQRAAALGYEYRIIDRAAWQAWLTSISGEPTPELEVVKRTLRLKDRALTASSSPQTGPAPRPAATALAAPAAATPAAVAPRSAPAVAKPAAAAPAPSAPSSAPAPLAPSAAPAPATPAPAAATASPAPAAVDDAVRARVLAIVAETTGYPPDMLDDSLDLEADLGVDTVKQAETFAAVRAAFDIPRQDNLRLRDFPTLAHVIEFVFTHRPDLRPSPAPTAPPTGGGGAPPTTSGAPGGAPPTTSGAPGGAPPTTSGAPSTPHTAREATTTTLHPRKVPTLLARPPLTVFAPTAVTLGAGACVLLMRDRGGAGEALAEALTARGVRVLEADAETPAEELLAQLAQAGEVTGVYWLPALDDEGDLRTLGAAGCRAELDLRCKRLAKVARALYPALEQAGSFVVAATRLGGAHGYDDAGATAPLGGAVTGMIKALARERPAALCKAVDFGADTTPSAIASALLAETLADPGAVELGYREGQRLTLGFVATPLDPSATPRFDLNASSQIVVTGAAGSIVAEIVAYLAEAARGGTFTLLDLAPPPSAALDLPRYRSDREGLRRELFERAKARGERATPALIERELAVLERQAAAQRAIEAITTAGGTAHYYQVDLRDGAAVTAALAQVRANHRLDLLLHAGGLEVSHLLLDKPDAEFDRVFDVKADGWFHLLDALGEAELGAAVVFSSIAGRFGNGGQTDYSAANDLLCKLISNLRRTRPSTRGVAIDWTAWAEIGMASRGSIPKLMQLAGIELLPPEQGIPAVLAELRWGGGEVIIAGALGGLIDEPSSGGLELARLNAELGRAPRPMIEQVLGYGRYRPLVVEAVLDPKREPFLDHHRIDGTAVLPGVMGLEAFAELATLALPELAITALVEVRFESPFKLYRDEPRPIRLEAWLRPTAGGVVAECALLGERVLPGRAEPQRTRHFSARVQLAPALPPVNAGQAPTWPNSEPVRAAEIYRLYFHGPAYQVLDAVWIDDDQALGRMALPLPQDCRCGSTYLAPRLIELCFQTAGIWEARARGGRLALPHAIEEVRLLAPPSVTATGPAAARVTARQDGRFDAVVHSADGTPLLELRGYQTVTLGLES